MKKIYYFILPLLALALHSCNPLDDTYSQLEKTPYQKSLTLTLAQADYKLLAGETASGASNAAKYFDFSSNDEARSLVPIILKKKYPYFSKGSSVLVTYDLYNSVGFKNVVSYTMASADYTAGGFNYGNLSTDADVEKAALTIYGDEVGDGKTVNLTYKFYSSGSTTDKTSKVVFWGGSWHVSYTLASADYTAMQQSYPDFTDKTVAASYIQTYMGIRFPYNNKAGDYKAIVYDYYVSSTRVHSDVLLIFQYDGTQWMLVQNIQPVTGQFGFNGTVWEPDNTVKYTMVTADYQAMGTAATDGDPKVSLLKYNNFDLSLWKDNSLIYSLIGNRLLTLFPNATEGQKYLVTYATYNPSGSASVHLILTGGKYVLVDE